MSLIKRIDVQNLRQTEWEISKGVLAAGAFCAPLAELQETTFKDFVKGPLTNPRESVTQFASTFDGNRLGYYLEGGRGAASTKRSIYCGPLWLLWLLWRSTAPRSHRHTPFAHSTHSGHSTRSQHHSYLLNIALLSRCGT